LHEQENVVLRREKKDRRFIERRSEIVSPRASRELQLIYGKNDFAEISKNLFSYRSENNFI